MTDSSNTDLDYLRNVAAAGENAPLVGGRFLVMWGGLTSIACVIHWLITSGMVAAPLHTLGYSWGAMVVIGIIGNILLRRSISAKPGLGSIGNRVQGAAWMSVGGGIVLYAIGVAFSVTALDAPALFFDTILTISLFGYAIAFAVTASLSGQRWLFAPAWMSIAGAALSPAFIGRPVFYLLVAGILLAAAVWPGLRLMRQEPVTSDD